MSDFRINGRLPPINPHPSKDVRAEKRSSAIEFINRHNFIFKLYNIDDMVNTFLPDGAVYEVAKTGYYGYLIPGVGRLAANHVVDRDEDGGVIVRYQQSMLRYGDANDDKSVAGGGDTEKRDGLPAIWWFATSIDRLRMTDQGWKIKERILGPSYRNANLDLPAGQTAIFEKD